jgi:hypothetical protein
MARPDHVARVYAVPPAEFTATRNRLAAELRKNGHADAARAVARLRKPSAALWAVNRLARTEGKSLAAFFDAVARLRRTQLREPRQAAEALQAQRAALDSLVARGRQILTSAGLTASQQALRRLSDTLMGAAVDRDHADTLRRGELTGELSAPGFEAFSGTRVDPRPRLRLVRSSETPAPRTVDRDAERRQTLEAEELARRAADHARAVGELEAETGSARARVADLDRRLRIARKAARQAAAAAKRASGRRPSPRPGRAARGRRASADAP